MKTILSRKCGNCGGELEALSNSILKCPYCGSTFNSVQAQSAVDKNIQVSETAPQSDKPVENTAFINPKPSNKRSSGNAVLFILFLTIISFVIYIITYNHGRYKNITLPIDSLRSDSLAGSRTDSMDDDGKRHIKGTYPLKVLIVKNRIHTDKYETDISITYKNIDTGILTYVEFKFIVLDKSGHELNADKWNTRGTGKLLEPGGVSTEEWSLSRRVPQAKHFKVELKQVGFGDTVWDY